MFSRVSVWRFDLRTSWESLDRPVLSLLESPIQPALCWAEHDEAVFSQIETLQEKGPWMTHDHAVFQLAMAIPTAFAAAWRRHDESVLSKLLLPRKTRRSLARARSDLEELTTTLVRGVQGAPLSDINAYDQDTLFEGGAAGYSL